MRENVQYADFFHDGDKVWTEVFFAGLVLFQENGDLCKKIHNILDTEIVAIEFNGVEDFDDFGCERDGDGFNVIPFEALHAFDFIIESKHFYEFIEFCGVDLLFDASKFVEDGAFFYGDSFLRIKDKKLLQKIDRLIRGIGKQFGKILSIFLILRQIFYEFLALIGDVFDVVKVRNSQILTDQLNLILSIRAGKKGLPLQHLSKNTTHTPHIHRCCVMTGTQQQFRSSIPSRGNIFREYVGLHILEQGSGESEVADLEITVGVDKQIAWFLYESIPTKSRWTILAE